MGRVVKLIRVFLFLHCITDHKRHVYFFHFLKQNLPGRLKLKNHEPSKLESKWPEWGHFMKSEDVPSIDLKSRW